MKDAPRVFVAPALLDALEAAGRAPTDRDITHRARKVLRLADGSPLRLLDGAGRGARVTLDGEHLILDAPVHQEPRALPALTIAQALIRPKKLEQVVKRGTELGASAFWVFEAARSQGRAGDGLQTRLSRIVEDATRQCERAWAPTIAPVQSFAGLCASLAEAGAPAFVGVPGARTPLSQALADPAGPATFVIGPEGGLTPDELSALAAAGAQSVSLGAHVLRTETAGLAALAAFQVAHGVL